MNRPRLSVAALMGLVAYVAVAFAALASPAPLWAGATLMGSLGLLAVAALGALFDRGEGRAFWSGVAIVGWGYLALVFGPWSGATFGPRLATTMMADALYLRLDHVPTVGETIWADIPGGNHEGTITDIDTESKSFAVYNFTYVGNRGAIQNRFLTAGHIKTIGRDGYRETLHCLACPIFALLGGAVARRFAGRGRRPGSPPEMNSHLQPGAPPCDVP